MFQADALTLDLKDCMGEYLVDWVAGFLRTLGRSRPINFVSRKRVSRLHRHHLLHLLGHRKGIFVFSIPSEFNSVVALLQMKPAGSLSPTCDLPEKWRRQWSGFAFNDKERELNSLTAIVCLQY